MRIHRGEPRHIDAVRRSRPLAGTTLETCATGVPRGSHRTATNGQRQGSLEGQAYGVPLPGDVHLEAPARKVVAGDRSLGAEVGQADARADRLPPRRAGHLAGRSGRRAAPAHRPTASARDPRPRGTPGGAAGHPRRGGPDGPRAPPGRGSPCHRAAPSRRPARPRPACSRGSARGRRRGSPSPAGATRSRSSPRCVAPRSAPSPSRASWTAPAWSTGTISSHPSSPTYVIRVARTGASPIVELLAARERERLLPRSASVSRASSSLDRGPITPITAYAGVTSRTRTSRPSGTWRRIQSWSRSVVAELLTRSSSVGPVLVTVRSDS